MKLKNLIKTMLTEVQALIVLLYIFYKNVYMHVQYLHFSYLHFPLGLLAFSAPPFVCLFENALKSQNSGIDKPQTRQDIGLSIRVNCTSTSKGIEGEKRGKEKGDAGIRRGGTKGEFVADGMGIPLFVFIWP